MMDEHDSKNDEDLGSSPDLELLVGGDDLLPELSSDKFINLVGVNNSWNGESFNSADIYDCSLEEVIANYVQYYASGAGHTAKAKRYDLYYFHKFLTKDNKGVIKIRNWTLQTTNDFIDSRLAAGEAPSTVSRRLATLKHFGRTLGDRVPGFINPAREVKPPSYKLEKPQGLSKEIVQVLKESAKCLLDEKSNSFSSVRNLVLLDVLLATGLRADEVRLLKRSQVSTDFSWLKNVKTKGKKFRDVYLHEGVSNNFKEYLEISKFYIENLFPEARELNQQAWAQFPVFISSRGASISDPQSFTMAPKTLWRVISEIGKRANLISECELPNLHPHKLRHAFAHGLLDSSNDIRLVAQALGHSDVRTTMRYTERSKEELVTAIEISREKGKL